MENYEKQVKLRKESITDELTGLWNRRYFLNGLEEIIISAERNKDIFSMIFIDVNNFKEINDRFGHETGDRVLIIIGQMLQRICRKNDLSARFGGDEFVILANYTDKTGAGIMIQRMRDLLEKVKLGDTGIIISIAAGVSEYPTNGNNVDTLIDTADKLMYKNKNDMKPY